jgi:hypothetical protein
MADPTLTASEPDRLDGLELQAEQNRAALVGTVDTLRSRLSSSAEELRQRVSPDALKEDAKHYITQTGRDLLVNLEHKAREHPLQTVALGAGLAYPVWQVVRSLPAPILLIGAGVALAGRGGRSGAASQRPSADRAEASFSEQGTVRGTPQPRSNALGEAGAAVSSGVAAVGETTSAAASRTAEAASRFAAAATDAVSSSPQAAHAAVSHAGTWAAEAGRAGAEDLAETVRRQPLLLGGLSILLGAALAACLPATRAESEAFGKASDEVKDRLNASASKGLEAVKAAGERVLQDALDVAEENGLTPQAAKEAANDLRNRAQAAAESTLETVSGGASPSRASSVDKPAGK